MYHDLIWRFQVTEMLKINIMKHSTNKYRTDDSLKFRLGIIARLLYSPRAFEELKILLINLDNNFPNIEIVYYILCLGEWIDVEKSCFQRTNTLKMNIKKHSTKKYRTDDFFVFSIRHFCTCVLITMAKGGIPDFTYHITITFQKPKLLPTVFG